MYETRAWRRQGIKCIPLNLRLPTGIADKVRSCQLQFLLLQGVQFAFRVHQVSNFSSLISAVSDIEVSSFVFPHHGYGSFEPNQPSPVFVVWNFRSKTMIGNCLHLEGWCKSFLSLMWLWAWLISEFHCMFKMTKYLYFGLLFGCSLLEALMMTVWQHLMHYATEHILAITPSPKSQSLIDFSRIKSYCSQHQAATSLWA